MFTPGIIQYDKWNTLLYGERYVTYNTSYGFNWDKISYLEAGLIFPARSTILFTGLDGTLWTSAYPFSSASQDSRYSSYQFLNCCGGNVPYMVRNDGTLWYWVDTVGYKSLYQEGTAAYWSYVCSGWDSLFAIDTYYTLYVKGENGNGQLGNGTGVDVASLTAVPFLRFRQVSCSYFHSLAIRYDPYTEDYQLLACGFNNSGQLGDGTTTQRLGWTIISEDWWKKVSAGGGHSLAIKYDGTLWATGENGSGQLGLGDTTDRDEFTQVGEDTWIDIYAGLDYSCGIKSDFTLWQWGSFSSPIDEPTQVGESLFGSLNRGYLDDYSLLAAILK